MKAFNYRHFITILLFLILSSQVLAGQNEEKTGDQIYRAAYFEGFPFWESPLQPLKLKSPMTAEDAMHRVHVRVDYDRYNRVIGIKTKQGKDFKALGNFFQSLYVHAVQTKIEYLQNKEIHRFYNKFDSRITGWGKVWEKTYHKDSKGRYVRMDFTDKKGRPVENSWGILFYEWQHLMDGSVVESRYSQSGKLKSHRPGFEFKRIRLVYSSDGSLSLMQNVDENFSLVESESGAAQYKYYYEQEGKFDRWEVFDKNGTPTEGPTDTAGEYYTHVPGRSSRITFFDPKDGPAVHSSGAVHWLMSYDQYGNIKSLEFFDENNHLVNGTYKHAKIEYIWDKKGLNLLFKNYYDKDGIPTTHLDGHSKVRYIYNNKGMLQETHFLDTDGQLVLNKYQKAAVIQNQYNEKLELIKSIKLDTNRKKI